MANPWDKYAGQSGPWNKYSGPTATATSEPPPPNYLLVGAPPLPHMLSRDVATPSTGTETEARQKYYDTYHQDPGPGFMHNQQGAEELGGASLVGIGAPVLAAGVEGGIGAGVGALGHTLKKTVVDALTGAAAGYGTEKGARALGAPSWLANIAGTVAGVYGWNKADLIQGFMKDTLERGEVPTLGKFARWSADRARSQGLPPVPPTPGFGLRPPLWEGMPEVSSPPLGQIEPIEPPAGYTRRTPATPAIPPKARPQFTAPPADIAPGPAAPQPPFPWSPRQGLSIPPVASSIPDADLGITTPQAPTIQAPAGSPKLVVPPPEDMKPMDVKEAHRYAHAQATEAELPGSPSGTSRGAHDWLSQQAKAKYGVKNWHELSAAQMQDIGSELLEQNRAQAKAARMGTTIPPVK